MKTILPVDDEPMMLDDYIFIPFDEEELTTRIEAVLHRSKSELGKALYVRNLRKKLRKAGFPVDEHLQTVWGVGYKWKGINK